jgi:hypothetical protein
LLVGLKSSLTNGGDLEGGNIKREPEFSLNESENHQSEKLMNEEMAKYKNV